MVFDELKRTKRKHLREEVQKINQLQEVRINQRKT